jgi:hypothetical protein
VRRWSHLHLRTARFVEVSLIQIIRHGASGKARDRQQSVGSCGMAINPLLWPRSARRIACATRMSMAIASTSRNCGYGHPTAEYSGAHRTLDVGGCLCTQSVGPGSPSGGRLLSTVGDASLPPHVGAGATSHAHPFARVGNTRAPSATAWKGTGTSQRFPSHAQNSSGGDSQKEQKDHICLSLIG